MATKTRERERMRAREACVITVGARPIVWERRIVRNNRTGRLDEIDIHELEPVDPGDEGIAYVFARHEEVWSDHPAVLDAPGCFVAIDE
jgi:hypothetical protein